MHPGREVQVRAPAMLIRDRPGVPIRHGTGWLNSTMQRDALQGRCAGKGAKALAALKSTRADSRPRSDGRPSVGYQLGLRMLSLLPRALTIRR